jgi:general secretion pathway protein C
VRPAFTLFGLAAKTTPRQRMQPSLNQVPVSSLKLRLAGLLASSNPARSIAIIEKEISRLALASAILSRGMMRGSPPFCPTGSSSTIRGAKRPFYYLTIPARRRHRPPPRPSAPVKRLREQPQNILTYLSISPVLSGDKLQGYRLNPGKDASLFRQSGLQANDLAIALNGIDLRDQEQAQQALQNLADMTEITLTVEREGQRHDIAFALGDE